MLELKVDDSIYRIRIFENYLKIVIKYQGKYYTIRVSCKNKIINWDDKRRKHYRLPSPNIPLKDKLLIEKYIKHLIFI